MFQNSDYFILFAAAISMLFSIYLWFSGHQDAGLYVGIWVPSIIGLGCYIKIIGVRKDRN